MCHHITDFNNRSYKADFRNCLTLIVVSKDSYVIYACGFDLMEMNPHKSKIS